MDTIEFLYLVLALAVKTCALDYRRPSSVGSGTSGLLLSGFDLSPLPPEPYPIPLRLSPKLLILAFAFLQQDDIMHIVAQKDLQRTTIYSADAHEMSFR